MSPVDPDLARALSKMMRADLDVWSNCWFWSLVGSTIAVAIGIICEAPEVWQAVGLGRKTVARIRTFWYARVRKSDLNGWERLCPEPLKTNEHHRKWIARAGFVGWTLVALGVAGEGVAEYFVNDAETNLRSFDQAVLTETQQSANSAAMASSLANTFSDNAVTASSNSLTLAKGARREADSFEKDIVSAKTQAAEAESHLAEATKSANILTAKLERLTTPRRLPHSVLVKAPLQTFRGTEYVFIGTCGDQECFDLVSDIDELLKLAGWKRIKGPPMRIGITQVLIHEDKEFAVDISVSTGIGMAVETPNGMESLKGISDDQLAGYIRAAISLNKVLALNVSPSDNTGRLVAVKLGTSTTVEIDVGRKPL